MLIKNIKWDTDGDMEALVSLPTEVYTPPFLELGFEAVTEEGTVQVDTMPD